MRLSTIVEMQLLMDWCEFFTPIFVICDEWKDVDRFRRVFMRSADGLYSRAQSSFQNPIVDTSRYLGFDRHGILDLFDDSDLVRSNTLIAMNAARSRFEENYKRCLFIVVPNTFKSKLVDFPDLFSISKLYVLSRQTRVVGKQRARKLRRRGIEIQKLTNNKYSWKSNIYI